MYSGKGSVSAAVVAGIAGDAGNGIQGGDVLVVPEAAPQVRIVGMTSVGQRVVTPNLLEVVPEADLAPLLPLLSVVTIVTTLGAPASGEATVEFQLTYGPNGDPAPAGTGVLVAYESNGAVVVSLSPGSEAGSALAGQAVLSNQGLVWARVGVGGTVALLFSGVAANTLDVIGQQLAGIGTADTDAVVLP